MGLIVCVLAGACAADDPIGRFDVDASAAAEAAADPTAASTDGVDSSGADEEAGSGAADSGADTIEIPEDALDLTGQSEIEIEIEDNVFVQRVVVVSAGTTITWTNEGRNEHNVRPSQDGAFEAIPTAELAEKGDSAARTFDSPGDYPYFCSLHGTASRGQTGRLIVVSPGGD